MAVHLHTSVNKCMEVSLWRHDLQTMFSDSSRDVASGRMQLRGLIKLGREQYEEMPVFADLQQMLISVERAESTIVATEQ